MKFPARPDRPLACVLTGMLLYTVILGWACHAEYDVYGYGDFDLAIDAQATWNLLHGSIESSIHRIPFLGNHMRLILFPIALLYAIFRSPLLLLDLQVLVLASGALAVYLLGTARLPKPWAACVALLYLVYPPLVFMNLYEFHPVALATAFLLWMLYGYDRKRFGFFLVFLLLALS